MSQREEEKDTLFGGNLFEDEDENMGEERDDGNLFGEDDKGEREGHIFGEEYEKYENPQNSHIEQSDQPITKSISESMEKITARTMELFEKSAKNITNINNRMKEIKDAVNMEKRGLEEEKVQIDERMNSVRNSAIHFIEMLNSRQGKRFKN